jgi:hypothetical protein
MFRKKPTYTLLLAAPLAALSLQAATITHNLNVEIIQVRDDAGENPTPLFGSDGGSYVYETQVNEIWSQAGIQVTFSSSTWNNTEAQRLTSTERGDVYGNSFSAGSGDSLPTLGFDAIQIFFVLDHPGTGYDGTTDSGWVGNPLSDPNSQARNAGNAQLYIDGTFASNGRAVMANEGFTADQLSTTIAHEIGHTMGLRHVEDINGGAGAGTTQDPSFTVSNSTPNLMWGAGSGPAYDGNLDDDPELTTLQENGFILADQTDAAIYNGLRLDPDGNGTGVLQAIPEPSGFLAGLVCLAALFARRRA